MRVQRRDTSFRRSVCRLLMDVSRSLMTVRMGPQLNASPHSAVSSLRCSSGGSLHVHRV